jgi:hypothetical protein
MRSISIYAGSNLPGSPAAERLPSYALSDS